MGPSSVLRVLARYKVFRRFLPWDYGVRNLFRRPSRSLLTLGALGIVSMLVLVIVGSIRGLEQSLSTSGDPQVALVFALGAGEGLENSSIPAQTPDLLAASLSAVQRRYRQKHVSAEIYLATQVRMGDDGRSLLGLVRGVTHVAPLVRRRVRIVEGKWPGPGEVLAGSLAPAELGCPADSLSPGRQVWFEGRTWRISGRFTAGGSAFDSELWCPLADLQQATKRQDVSLVAMLLGPGGSMAEVAMFCQQRRDLALEAMSETAYYQSLEKHYRPVRRTAWLVAALVVAAGVFAGLNTMYGAVASRTRELATLQALGFRRGALVVSLVQEAALLAAAGSLVAALVALIAVHGMALRFTMGAFTLRIDGVAILVGCGAGLMLGGCGAIPPAVRALRLPVAESLKAV